MRAATRGEEAGLTSTVGSWKNWNGPSCRVIILTSLCEKHWLWDSN